MDIQTSISILSLTVAIIAIVVAFRVENRNQKRFDQGISESKKIAEANVKPLLAIYTIGYETFRGMRLANQGQGTAVITNVVLHKNGVEGQNAADLVDLPQSMFWDTYWRFGGTNLYIKAGDERRLLELSQKNLIAQGIDEKEASEILSILKDEMNNIEITIEYEDIIGNKQPDCHLTPSGSDSPS